MHRRRLWNPCTG